MAAPENTVTEDHLARELAEMSPSVLLDFVRGLMRQWERTSAFHAQACDREDAAVALAAQWQERYEQAQAKLDAIGRIALDLHQEMTEAATR
jgi:ABC-type Fe3+-hydroxamate transport system substrate-binding protein